MTITAAFTLEDRKMLSARLRAIDFGDKALGREIYHQLQERGWQGHQIDEVTAADLVEADPEPVEPVETADGPDAPERAVPAKPSRRRRG